MKIEIYKSLNEANELIECVRYFYKNNYNIVFDNGKFNESHLVYLIKMLNLKDSIELDISKLNITDEYIEIENTINMVIDMAGDIFLRYYNIIKNNIVYYVNEEGKNVYVFISSIEKRKDIEFFNL